MEVLLRASSKQVSHPWSPTNDHGLISEPLTAKSILPRSNSIIVHRFLLLRIIREAAIISLVALVPAAALFYHDQRAVVQHPLMAQPALEGALWIDARPEADYVREHVPGALNLNENNWDRALAQVFATWQPPRPLLVYCSAGCSSAAEVAGKLTALGLEPVEVYEGGFEAWKRSNAPSPN